MKNQEAYWYFLSSLVKMNSGFLEGMLKKVEDPEELVAFSGKELMQLGLCKSMDQAFYWDQEKKNRDFKEEYEGLKEKNIHFYSRKHENFPKRLLMIEKVPIGLFVLGRLPKEEWPAVSIIGSRKCSAYGQEMAYEFGKELGKYPVNILSGMALGVDGFAGRGALVSGNNSFSVLAGGVDICYPKGNLNLYQSLTERGGILSERPPGYQAFPGDFPLRNRLISGLSDCILVMEAAKRSGTCITVSEGLSQNKEIFALPGRITDAVSFGCNELIKNGAQVLTCVEDVLQFLQIPKEPKKTAGTSADLSKEEQEIYNRIQMGAKDMETLLKGEGWTLSKLYEILLHLELKGRIKKIGNREYRVL